MSAKSIDFATWDEFYLDKQLTAKLEQGGKGVVVRGELLLRPQANAAQQVEKVVWSLRPFFTSETVISAETPAGALTPLVQAKVGCQLDVPSLAPGLYLLVAELGSGAHRGQPHRRRTL